MDQNEDEWERKAETARALRKSIRTIERMADEGVLKSIKLGRHRLISVASRKAVIAEAVAKAQKAG
jgi:excisionase family DNA binding protein